jgi:hypothetical protein
VVLALLAAQFAWRSWLTHRVFNDTADEEVHIACGLEVWQRHQYTSEPQHPPLARVLLASLPHLAGGKPGIHGTWWDSGDEDWYWRTLSLARTGNLLFLPVLIFLVYRWGRELYGSAAALGSAALVAFDPNLLAHGSLATLDFGAGTMIFAACYGLRRWAQHPRSLGAAAWAAALAALAVLTKFSALFHLPAVALVFFSMARARPRWRTAMLFLVLACLLIWAGYGFSVRPLTRAQFPPPAGTFHERVQRSIERLAGDTPIPAPQFVRGVLDVLGHNAQGHAGYLLGEVRNTGWWYYFPVALAVKTTLPLLLLAAAGLAVNRRALYPGAAAAAVLGVSMASNLNMGIRHVLLLCPLFALMAGGVFASTRRALALAGLSLAAWHGVESVASHPDYLPYFNQIARGREDRFLLDSALDWGQDLQRLRLYLRANRIQDFYLSYFGRGYPLLHRIPGARPLPPHLRPAGWVAVSKAHLVGLALPGYDLGWLKAHPPRARIGKSILVYYFPAPPL